MLSKTLSLPLDVYSCAILNKSRPPSTPGKASNGGVKLVFKTCKSLPWVALLSATVALTGISHAQAPADSSAAVISPNSAGKADSAIEPRKPSIWEDSNDTPITVDPASLVPDLPPVPHEKATLVGGTIERLDQVRDRITVRLFGGGKETVLFDPRTDVSRAGKPANVADLREGDRIYLDTILDGSTVFARSMRLGAGHAAGESQGVVVEYRRDRGELTFRDSLTPNTVAVRVNSATRVTQADRAARVADLVPGTLISIGFSSDGAGKNLANNISILALPGTSYTFSGDIVHIDLRSGLLVLNSSTDHKTYEVYLSPSASPDEGLHAGANVTVVTNYDGSRYVVRTININSR